MDKISMERVIDFAVKVPVGSHVCLVYETDEQVVDIVVPYFEESLRNNEVGIWVLTKSLKRDKVKKALKMNIPGIDDYIEKEQMIIIGDEDVYTKSGRFDQEQTLRFWAGEQKKALDKGFKGISVCGNGNWVRQAQWNELVNYERSAQEFMRGKHIKAICAYSKEIAGLPEILSVGICHTKVVYCQGKGWKILDTDDIDLLLKDLVC